MNITFSALMLCCGKWFAAAAAAAALISYDTRKDQSFYDIIFIELWSYSQ